MKLIKCKRCDETNLHWVRAYGQKWMLHNSEGLAHTCNDEKIKMVKCKYCKSDTLFWAEEINPITHLKKMVLTEDYGLQHACDEYISLLAKEKQAKKDAYELEKKRIMSEPEGRCTKCNDAAFTLHPPCPNCLGVVFFNFSGRIGMFALVHEKIWPPRAGRMERW